MQIMHNEDKIISMPDEYIQPESNRIPPRFILYYLLWPFGVLFQAIKNFRKPWAKNLLWLLCLFFGLTFVVGEDEKRSNDALRYAEMLSYFHAKSLSFQDFFSSIYNPQEGFVDVFQPVVTWIVAIFTDNPKWLFAFFAFVFGYFYSRNIWILLQFFQFNRVSVVSGLIIIAFILINPIWNINGVRMWTAAQIFIYGIFNYFLLNDKKSGITWVLLTPFVHFSFFFPVIIFFIFLFLTINFIFLFISFIITSLIKDINLLFFEEQLSLIIPKTFEYRLKTYTNIDYFDSIKEQMEVVGWHVKFANLSFSIVLYSFVIIMFSHLIRSKKVKRMLLVFFEFGLFIGVISNLANNIPSGGRFLVLSNSVLIACYFIFLSLYKMSNKYLLLNVILSMFLIFWIIFSIRVGLDYSGFLLFIGNPLLAFFVTENTPLIDFIKEFIL